MNLAKSQDDNPNVRYAWAAHLSKGDQKRCLSPKLDSGEVERFVCFFFFFAVDTCESFLGIKNEIKK